MIHFQFEGSGILNLDMILNEWLCDFFTLVSNYSSSKKKKLKKTNKLIKIKKLIEPAACVLSGQTGTT